jgi:hypothetical protein
MASKKAAKNLKKGKRIQPVKNLVGMRKAGGPSSGTPLTFKF